MSKKANIGLDTVQNRSHLHRINSGGDQIEKRQEQSTTASVEDAKKLNVYGDKALKSGKKNEILEQFVRLYNKGKKIPKEALLEVEKYLVKKVDKWPNKTLNTLLNTFEILVDSNSFGKLKSHLSDIFAKLQPTSYIKPEQKELLSNILISMENSDFSGNSDIIKEVIDYYKQHIKILRKLGTDKEHIWRNRLSSILEIVKSHFDECDELHRGQFKQIIGEIFNTSRDDKVLDKIAQGFSAFIRAEDLIKEFNNAKQQHKDLEYQINQEEFKKQLNTINLQLNQCKGLLESHKLHNLHNTENAYSTAKVEDHKDSRYWYSSEDIALINQIWMRDFTNKVRVTQALGRQPGELLEDILTRIGQNTIEQYQQDRKSTIIPLNIADEHWVTIALIPSEDGKTVVLYKDSGGDKSYPQEREKVQRIFEHKLENIDFKYNKNQEQRDAWNCGVFTLSNVKKIAEEVTGSDKHNFISNFTGQTFAGIAEIDRLRSQIFPELYLESMFDSERRNIVLLHHQSDLQKIKALLEEKYPDLKIALEEESIPEQGIRLSLRSLAGDTFNSRDYYYLYVFEKDAKYQGDLIDLVKSITPEIDGSGCNKLQNGMITVRDNQLLFTDKADKTDPQQIDISIITRPAIQEYQDIKDNLERLKDSKNALSIKVNSSTESKLDYLEHLTLAFSQVPDEDLLQLDDDVVRNILLLGIVSNKDNVLNSSLKIADIRSKKDLSSEYLDKITINCSDTELILRVLENQDKLGYTENINSFLVKQLIANESPDDRSKGLNLLKKIDLPDGDIKRIIDLETRLEKGEDIRKLCQESIIEGKNITYNAFKELADKHRLPESQKIISQIVEKELQHIPDFVIDKYKELSRNEISDTIISLFKREYLKLQDFSSLGKLLEEPKTRGNVLELLKHHVLKGMELPEQIRSQVEELSKENQVAALILKLESKEKDIVDKLKDRGIATENKIKLLDLIVRDSKYHNPRIVNALELLAQYKPELRDKIAKTIISILPDGYTQRGYSGKLLNTIIAYSTTLDSDKLAQLVDKDGDADLTYVLEFIVQDVSNTKFKKNSFGLLFKVKKLLEDQVTKDTSEDNISDKNNLLTNSLFRCIQISYTHPDSETRNKLIEFIESYPKEFLEKLEIKKELIDELKTYNLDCKSVESLEKVKQSINEKNYIPTYIQLNSLIENLEYKELNTLSAEILLVNSVNNGISSEHLEKITEKIKTNKELLNDVSICRFLKNTLASTNNEDIIGIIENKIEASEQFEGEWAENITSVITGGIEREYSPKILSKLSDLMMVTQDESVQLQIMIYFSNQVAKKGNHTALSEDVVQKIKDFSLGKRGESEENKLLHKLAFKNLEYLDKKEQSTKFISEYCNKLYKHLSDDLQNNYKQAEQNWVDKPDLLSQLTSIKESNQQSLIKLKQCFGELDKQQSQHSTIYKKLHSICNAINASLYHIEDLDFSIFVQYGESEWVEEILASTLLKSASNSGQEEINEYQVSTFRDRLNALELTKENRDSKRGIEIISSKILELLLDRQTQYNYSLQDINDLMGYAADNENALELLTKNNFWEELESSWLKNHLSDITEIKEKSEEIEDQIKVLAELVNPYSYENIDEYLTKINNEGNNLEELIEFFVALSSSGLSKDSQEVFLTKLGSSSLDDAKTSLYKAQAESILATVIKNDNFDYQIAVPEGEEINPSIEVSDIVLLKKAKESIATLLENKWQILSLGLLMSKLHSEQSLKDMIQALVPVCEYGLKEYDTDIQDKSLIDILSKADIAECTQEIHDLAISTTFSVSKQKDVDELAIELEELNSGFISSLTKNYIIAEYKKITDKYDTIVNAVGTRLSAWKSEDVLQWSKKVKEKTSSPDIYKKLAVIKRAVEIFSEEKGKKITPRPIQLMSALIMLNGQEGKGRLAQINTGEGKTIIVAMLSVVKALNGNKVDVITSSSELAKPQSKAQEAFFEKFGLTVAHNGKDDDIDIKERYKADIVYGSAGDFQGDILRDEYSKLGTKSGRKCDIAIVDEVDSMLIDGKNHMVMLSTPMPAMDYLEPVLCTISQQIDSAANSIEERDGQAYFIEKAPAIGEDGKAIQGKETLYPLEGTKEEFLKTSTEKYVRKLLRDETLDDKQEFFDEELFKQKKLKEGSRDKSEDILKQEVIAKVKESFPKLVIPQHLREFVLKAQLTKWIDSAIHAKYRSEINKHYVLKNGNKIAPVDSSNTGVVQSNMNWSDGLHQFLQIKHGCKITAESITTNFISNVTYFKKYGSSIYGLTGTLGSQKAKELLNETYNVDSVIIPTFKQKQHKELIPIITSETEDWYHNIAESSLSKLRNGRAVLVITKYIEETDKIKKKLITIGYDKEKIKVYQTGQDSKTVEEALKSGEIIIATNIAGRGTDIIPSSKVEENGGLHVCVTFVPPNERVEQQNIGRTSRTGNKGTSQFIISDKQRCNIDALRLARNIKEEVSLEKAKLEIKKVTNKDTIFKKFCSLLDTLDTSRGIQKTSLTMEDVLKRNKVRAIEEKFGLWLKVNEQKLQEEVKEAADAIKLFADFEKELTTSWSQLGDDSSDAKINPIFYVLIGNILMGEKKYDEAIKKYDKAIVLDEHFAANAYYNRGYTKIAKNKKAYDARDDFEKARKIIEENLEPMLHVIQRSVVGAKGKQSSVLSEQVQHKFYLYNMQKNAINVAIGISQEKYDAQIKEIQAKLDATGDNKLEDNDRKSVEGHLKYLKDNKIAQISGEIGKIQNKEEEMQIEFSDIFKSFPEDEDVKLYKEEIEEYKNNGFKGSFKVTEIVPIDWWSVIGLGLIGLGQLVGGAALIVFTLGAGTSIGMGLISEGVSDLITSVKDGIINRDFSWESWGIQKAISMTVSLVCAGMGAIKDAAKTAMAGVKLGVEAAKTGVKTVATTTLKAGWKIAAKAVGTSIAKGVTKELMTELANYGIKQLVMPEIEKSLRESIEPKIQEALLANPNVKKMLELDSKNRNKFYQSKIKEIAMRLIHDEDSSIRKQILGYAKQFAEGVISGKAGSSSNKYVKIFAHAGTAAGMVKAVAELVTFVPEFTVELDKKINALADESGINKDGKEAEGTKANIATQQKFQPTQPSFDADTESSIEARIGKQQNTQQQATYQDQDTVNYTPEEIITLLSGFVANNMSHIIESRILKPATNMAASWGVDRLSKGLDRSVQEEIGNYQAERRIQFTQDVNISRIPKKLQKRAKDPQALSKALDIKEQLSAGGEVGLMHMGAISDSINKPIKVFDEKGKLVKIIGKEKGGTPVEVRYEKPNKQNLNGHYTLNQKGTDGKYKQALVSGNNNCLLDVVAAQVPKDVCKGGADLRQSLVQQMSTPEGQRKLASVAHDISRLEQMKPNKLLMGGGGTLKDRLEEIAKYTRYKLLSDGAPNSVVDQERSKKIKKVKELDEKAMKKWQKFEMMKDEHESIKYSTQRKADLQMLKLLETFKIGNCGENALVNYYLLKHHTSSNIEIKYRSKLGGDHAFVSVYNKSTKKTFIIDTWPMANPKMVFSESEYNIKMKETHTNNSTRGTRKPPKSGGLISQDIFKQYTTFISKIKKINVKKIIIEDSDGKKKEFCNKTLNSDHKEYREKTVKKDHKEYYDATNGAGLL